MTVCKVITIYNRNAFNMVILYAFNVGEMFLILILYLFYWTSSQKRNIHSGSVKRATFTCCAGI